MKKTILILMTAFVATTLYSCQPMSEKSPETTNKTENTVSESSIIGSWTGEKEEESAKGSYTYIFNEDGTGIATFNSVGEEIVNNNITMELNITGEMTFNWEKDNSTITIKATNLNMNLSEKDITFKCKDPQEAALYNSQKPIIVNQFKDTTKDLNKFLEQYSLDWKIKELSHDKLIVNEKGKIFEFTRAK